MPNGPVTEEIIAEALRKTNEEIKATTPKRHSDGDPSLDKTTMSFSAAAASGFKL